MSGEFIDMESMQKSTTATNQELRRRLAKQREITVILKRDLHKRTKEMAELSDAFERFLKARIKSKSRLRHDLSSTKTQKQRMPSPFTHKGMAARDTTSPLHRVNTANYDRDIHNLRKDYERIHERLYEVGKGIPLTVEFLSEQNSRLVMEELETMAPPLASTVERSLELSHAELKDYQAKVDPLQRLEENGETVDSDFIDDMSRGFEILKKFKALTHMYKKRGANQMVVVDIADKYRRHEHSQRRLSDDLKQLTSQFDAAKAVSKLYSGATETEHSKGVYVPSNEVSPKANSPADSSKHGSPSSDSLEGDIITPLPDFSKRHRRSMN